MTGQALTLALLLADSSACLRFLVLRDLLGRSAGDAELRELLKLREDDPVAAPLLAGGGEPRLTRGASKAIGAGIALSRLGYLGFGKDHPAVSGLASHLFALQRADGSWPLARSTEDGDEAGGPLGAGDAIPLQTAIPLRGLAMCGYAAEPRAQKAYRWLDAMRLDDGTWPTGTSGRVYRRVGGYRRLPQSRWGCRSNTTGVLLCLAHHERLRSADTTRRALDHVLARETRDRSTLGFEVARLAGAIPFRGLITFHAASDAALLLDLCYRIGVSGRDERVRGLVEFVTGLRGPAGLWELGGAPAFSRWLSFDLLRSLAGIDGDSDWSSALPRTAFAAYPRRPRRN